jgi:hypothetical protein
VSIQSDDEFSLRTGLEVELGNVMPSDGLAGAIITRYRRGRRRRVAGAVGLVMVFAGIGVPLGLGAGASPASGHTVLRLAEYTLTLPGQYQLVAARSALCRPRDGGTGPQDAAPGHQAGGPEVAAADGSSGGCIFLLLTSPFTPKAPGSKTDPDVPRHPRSITVGRYHAWLIPGGYGRSGGVALVIEGTPRAGQIRDLVINSTGLSRAALVSVVSAGLS